MLFFQVLPFLVLVNGLVTRQKPNSLLDQIQQVCPGSSTCAGAVAPDECRTATQSAPFFATALNGTTPGVQAAIFSLVCFETLDLDFRTNHFPGRPGQGTSSMMMFDFVLEYARTFPELGPQIDALVGSGVTTDQQKNDIRALVLDDKYNFGSAPWFLKNKCDASVSTALASGTDAAYAAYITQCVGTTLTDDRIAYWTRAKAAFGPFGLATCSSNVS
ncbi:hypothetical protein CPB83DRAFT_863915 [Crepidotus variabilis]|uniref:Uncharacterized protein n=1 Tax=Crepidotus variabilis TaxID=179855 RepID=A0A9P6E5G4_9AGAR|nr:hypothetical protein CPB83DRAFT_863915 [Crepidotus variabilis]